MVSEAAVGYIVTELYWHIIRTQNAIVTK